MKQYLDMQCVRLCLMSCHVISLQAHLEVVAAVVVVGIEEDSVVVVAVVTEEGSVEAEVCSVKQL